MALIPNARPLGYEQITGLNTVKSLTVPQGTSLVLITTTSQQVRWRDDGTNPTASVGYPLPAGGELVYTGAPGALRFIESAASATLDVVYYGAR